jgi:hypothetical protein
MTVLPLNGLYILLINYEEFIYIYIENFEWHKK